MVRVLLAVTLLSTAALTIGCGHHAPVRVKTTQGPDGAADWKQISCKRMDKRCFSTARALCPNGYIFTDGRRASATQAANATNATNATGAITVKELPPQESWGKGMYSKKSGTLLVRCADRSPTDDRSS